MRTLVVAVLAIVSGCTEAPAPEGMDPAGPPAILQVFVRERLPVVDYDGVETIGPSPRLAFGHHDDIDPEVDDGTVEEAVARDGQRIRVVVDELLRGNNLEEVACADGTWSRVPVGADFDDVAACAGPDLSDCEGICVGAGGAVGILDENGDGAIDDTRLIDGAVVLTCDGEEVPLDPQRSYYQPTGSQQLSTAIVGTDSLGPAVVIVPTGMRPGASCGLTFAPAVVDKQGVAVCAPSGGDCDPGDTSGIDFGVEPFLLVGSDPADGAEDVPLTTEGSSDAVVTIQLNAALAPDQATAAVAITADGVAVESAVVAVPEDNDAAVVIVVPGGFTAGAAYEVTVTGGASGIADIFEDTLGEDVTIAWTATATTDDEDSP